MWNSGVLSGASQYTPPPQALAVGPRAAASAGRVSWARSEPRYCATLPVAPRSIQSQPARVSAPEVPP